MYNEKNLIFVKSNFLTKFFYLIVILLLPSTSNATTWANEFPLHVYGPITFYETIYNFINQVVADDAINTFIQIGIMITMVFAGYRMKDEGALVAGKIVFVPLTLLVLFFTPTVKVHLVDMRVDKGHIDGSYSPGGGYATIDNVPYAIAFLPSSVFFINMIFTEIIDGNWSAVHDSNKLSGLGFQEMSKAVRTAVGITSFIDPNDPLTAQNYHNLNEYTRVCIINGAMNYKTNIHFINEPNVAFPDNLNPANFPFDFGDDRKDFKKFDDSIDTNQKCSDLYTTYIFNNRVAILEAIQDKISKILPYHKTDTAGFNDAFREQIGDTANKIGTLKTAVAATITARILEQQKAIDDIGLDGFTMATQLSIDSTLANMRADGPAKFEWVAQVLPKALFIITGIIIAAFPFFVLVQSFMGMSAYKAIMMYFMGLFAFSFNFVSLALVQNIVNFYTEQEAQETIASMMEMPFSVAHLPQFLMVQADWAGIAGLVGTASIFAVTPLVFYGETKGFSSALSAVQGAFRGNVTQISQDNVKDAALEAEIDEREANKISEDDAQRWLAGNGFTDDYNRNNMSALETMNNIMKGHSTIGSGLTAHDIYEKGYSQDLIEGSYLNSTSQTMKTVGVGKAIDSVQNAGDVAMQDGEVMAESINTTDRLRNTTSSGNREYGTNYDTEAIGAGGSASQFAKEKGMETIGNTLEDGTNSLASLVANSTNDAISSIANGTGLLQTGIFNNDGTVDLFNNKTKDYMDGIEAKSGEKTENTAGFGAKVDFGNAMEVANEDGQVAGQTVNKTNEMRNNPNLTNRDGEEINWNVEDLSRGNSILSVGKDTGIIGTGEAISNTELEQYLQGTFNKDRKSANDVLGMGIESYTEADMKNIQTESKAGYETNIEKGDAKKQIFGDDLNKSNEVKTLSDTQKSKIDSLNGANDVLTQNLKSNEHDMSKTKDYIGKLEEELTNTNNTTGKEQIEGRINEQKDLLASQQENAQNIAEQISNNNSLKSNILDNPDLLKELDFRNVINLNELANNMSMVGNAAGVGMNLENNPEMYSRNALYSEMSKQQTTDAKIDAQGGVLNAVKTDTVDSAIKSMTQQMSLDKNLKESGKADEGLKTPIENLTNAVNKLADTSSSMEASKTAGDIATVETAKNSKYGSIEEFSSDSSKVKTTQDTSRLAKLQELANNPKEALEKIRTSMNKQRVGSGDAFVEPFMNKEGLDFISAVASQNATVFSGHNALVGGDGRVFSGAFNEGNVSGKVTGGISQNDDSSTSISKGQEDRGIIKDQAKNALGEMFGPETAEHLISAWNAYGEVLAGAGVASAGVLGMKKFSKAKTESKDTKGENKDGKTSTNLDQSKEQLEKARENYNKYDSDLKNVQNDISAKEANFNKLDRDGKLNQEMKTHKQNEIKELKEKESKLKENRAKAASDIEVSKRAVHHYSQSGMNKSLYDDYTQKEKEFGDVKTNTVVGEGDGKQKVMVDGVDANGNEKSYNANNTNSRNAYLKHNTKASSDLVKVKPSFGERMNEIFRGSGSWKTKATAAVLTTAGLASDTVGEYVEAGMNLMTAPTALLTPTSMGSDSYLETNSLVGNGVGASQIVQKPFPNLQLSSATINAETGQISNYESLQTGGLFTNNSSTYANNTSTSMADSLEDTRSYMMELASMAETNEIIAEYLRPDEKEIRPDM